VLTWPDDYLTPACRRNAARCQRIGIQLACVVLALLSAGQSSTAARASLQSREI
jgi:hypothetical protein